MIARALSDSVILPTRKDVLRIQLYFKLVEKGIKPFENDMDIILELYLFGGYNNAEEQSKFIDACVEKRLKKSNQSVRNTLSKYTTIGVLDKPRNTILHVNEEFVPKLDCEKVVLMHKITHAE